MIHRPVVAGTQWMITADHPLAAQAGAAVLEAGGNAVDAAVAANLVMAVVRPHMCGLGGDLFALVFDAQTGRLEALDACGRSSYQADLGYFLDKGFTTIPESGWLSATVPGALDGWQALLSRYGTKRLDQLLPRAIEYAENGFPVYPELVQAISERRRLLAGTPAAAEIFLKGGRLPGIGTRLIQADLAKSLQLIAAEGIKAFYQGPLGQALVEGSRQGGGLFAQEDLAGHDHRWVEPLGTSYRGYQICTTPPSTQGLALLLQANILKNFNLSGMEYGSWELVRLMVEAKKAAFADRDRYVCDPEFHQVPTEKLLSKEYGRELAASIKAGFNEAPGPQDHTAAGEDTVYLAVVDADGNAVSMIQSLYEFFGSGVMVPGTGIMLHNRGRGFSLDPDHPNRIEPNKRPYHTLHPAMILKDGRPWAVLGSPGADGQTQTVMQLTAGLLDFGLDPQQAVEAPRWRHHPDGTLFIESRFPADAISGLKSTDLEVLVLRDWDGIMGSAQIIRVDRDQGVLLAGADPRRQAYAAGR